MIKPMQNAVAEVNVITTVPPAEYGHSAGGVRAAPHLESLLLTRGTRY